MTSTPTVQALLDMEGTVDDLEGIADVLYKITLSGDAGKDDPGLNWLARVSERTVEKLEEQWSAALVCARGPNHKGPVLGNDGGGEK